MAGDEVQTVVVKLEGDVDLESEPKILLALKRALSGNPNRVELDVSGVTFLDSSGLSVLLSAERIAAHHNARLSLVKAPPVVRRVVEATGLTQVLEVGPDSSGGE